MKAYHWIILAVAFLLATWFIFTTREVVPRSDTPINLNWKFVHGDPEGASAPAYDDSDWRFVSLPHDWMIELQPDSAGRSGVAGGFYPGGIGWYRKTLDLSGYRDSEQYYLLFEGVQRNAEVWFNGTYLGKQVYGYASFYHDISSLVRQDTLNVIAVRTDCSGIPIDRWYPGAGIYRDVRLVATNSLHTGLWGKAVRSVTDTLEGALMEVELEVLNNRKTEERFKIRVEVTGPEGKMVAEGETGGILKAGERGLFRKKLVIPEPLRWSPDHPHLYKVTCSLSERNRMTDQVTIPHGFRTAEFDPQRGFLLNGKKVLMKGVCIHHDGGELGAAVPLESWRRRLEILKELGVNAIRLAHNPHAPGVLDLCDQMGFLVIDEMYDKWEQPWPGSGADPKFEETWETDLENFIKRDLNHPSVVLWSLGNETMEQLNDPERGIAIYREMKQLVERIDPTRPVTCAMHPGSPDRGHEIPSSMMHVSPVVSYNYRTDSFGVWHERYPDLVFIATETKAYGTHGREDYQEIDFSDNSWNDLDEFVAGQFIWTGFDYLGESMGWPDRGFRHGLAQTNGFIKPHAWYIGARYREDPLVKLAVKDSLLADSLNRLTHWQTSWSGAPLADHWTFPGLPGEKEVVVFTNCPQVELYLNSRLVGSLEKEDFADGVIRTRIPYEPGQLIAKASWFPADGGTGEVTDTLLTAASPFALAMEPDVSNLSAKERRLLHITTEAVDSAGRLHPHSSHLVNYRLEGPGRIRTIDNGDVADHTPYGSASGELRKGRQLLILQAGGEPGDLIISATADGLKASEVRITSDE